MKVFISHKSEDMELADECANILKEKGFDIYLDKYDPYINESQDRAKRIESKIDSSTDLLVIITENTKSSWWVPFEIGLSTAKDIRIVSLVFENAPKLPSFIRKWPIVDTEWKFNFYLEQLEKDKKQLLIESSYIRKSMSEEAVYFSERASLQNIRKSDLFHDVLLHEFGQV